MFSGFTDENSVMNVQQAKSKVSRSSDITTMNISNISNSSQMIRLSCWIAILTLSIFYSRVS